MQANLGMQVKATTCDDGDSSIMTVTVTNFITVTNFSYKLTKGTLVDFVTSLDIQYEAR